MTVKSDLKKALAAAVAAKGTYMTAAESTQDTTAKSRYEEMVKDAQSHEEFLQSRLAYLDENTIS